jgi:hypothetical protein
MPVRPQFKVTELAAAGKQADLETERLRLKALAATSVVELAREKMPPPPPPPLKQVSSEQLNSLALCASQLANMLKRFSSLKFECCSLCSRCGCAECRCMRRVVCSG